MGGTVVEAAAVAGAAAAAPLSDTVEVLVVPMVVVAAEAVAATRAAASSRATSAAARSATGSVEVAIGTPPAQPASTAASASGAAHRRKGRTITLPTVTGRDGSTPDARHNGVVASRDSTGSGSGRLRMTGKERREQLLVVGRKLFAEKGFEGTTVEEIAAQASVSKPVVYEHFGGKEGLYAVVVDREIRTLLDGISGALEEETTSRGLLEAAALSLLGYIESSTDGFRILVRDSPPGQPTGSFASLISDVATQVEHLLAAEFKARRLDTRAAPLYAQMLVGMVALTGQWWLESPKFKKTEVAAHLVNLAWNGLSNLEQKPRLGRDT